MTILVLGGQQATEITVPFDSDIRGSSASETIRIPSREDEAGPLVEYAAGSGDRVAFEQALNAYTFEQQGNVLVVDNAVSGERSEIAVNGGFDLAFADGRVSSEIRTTDAGPTIHVGGHPLRVMTNDGTLQEQDIADASINLNADDPSNVSAPSNTGEPVTVVFEGEQNTIEVPFAADVRGTAAGETVQITESTDIGFTGNTGDRVAFADDLAAYDFAQRGNQVRITGPDGGTTDVALNGDVDLAFADGTTTASIGVSDGAITVRVGGVDIGQTGDVAAANPSLDGSDTSAIADEADPSLSLTAPDAVSEGETLTVTVEADQPLDARRDFQVELEGDGFDVNDVDQSRLTWQGDIGAGETAETIDLDVLADNQTEGDEDINVTLGGTDENVSDVVTVRDTSTSPTANLAVSFNTDDTYPDHRDEIRSELKDAWQNWMVHMDPVEPSTITLNVKDGMSEDGVLARAGHNAFVDNPINDPNAADERGIVSAKLLGEDNFSFTPDFDAEMRIKSPIDVFEFQDGFNDDKSDAETLFTHELGHVLGILSSDTAPFGHRSVRDDTGKLVFDGDEAGRVPLSDPAHLEAGLGVMDGAGLSEGQREPISDLELAILDDMNHPVREDSVPDAVNKTTPTITGERSDDGRLVITVPRNGEAGEKVDQVSFDANAPIDQVDALADQIEIDTDGDVTLTEEGVEDFSGGRYRFDTTLTVQDETGLRGRDSIDIDTFIA